MSIKKSAVSPPINAFHKDKEIKKIISSTTPKKKKNTGFKSKFT